MDPIDFNGLDTVVHGPVRLGVLTSLQVDGPLEFTRLKKRLNVGDGALAAHLAKLEGARYVSCDKSFVGRRPRSTYRITATGRRALLGYFDALRTLIETVERARK
jgi:DNA-binding PadR family transcriptional regulator